VEQGGRKKATFGPAVFSKELEDFVHSFSREHLQALPRGSELSIPVMRHNGGVLVDRETFREEERAIVALRDPRAQAEHRESEQ